MGLLTGNLTLDSGLTLPSAYVSLGDGQISIFAFSPPDKDKYYSVYTTYSVWPDQAARESGKPPICKQNVAILAANTAQVAAVYDTLYEHIASGMAGSSPA